MDCLNHQLGLGQQIWCLQPAIPALYVSEPLLMLAALTRIKYRIVSYFFMRPSFLIIFSGKPRKMVVPQHELSPWFLVNFRGFDSPTSDMCGGWCGCCWGIHLSLEGSLLYLYHLLQRLSQAFLLGGGDLGILKNAESECTKLWFFGISTKSCQGCCILCPSLIYLMIQDDLQALILRQKNHESSTLKPLKFEYLVFVLGFAMESLWWSQPSNEWRLTPQPAFLKVT